MHPMVVSENYSSLGMRMILIKVKTVCISTNIFAVEIKADSSDKNSNQSIILSSGRKLCLAKDHWWGFSTRNAHMVHVVNLIRLKMVYAS